MRLHRFAFAFAVICGCLLLLVRLPAHAASLPATPNPDLAAAPPLLPPFSSESIGGSPIITYTNRTAFNAANPNLAYENFEAGLAAPNSVVGCPAPISNETNNACFAEGTLLPGVEYTDRPLNSGYGGDSPNGLLVGGAGFAGSTSKTLLSNTLVDSFQMRFEEPTYAVGFDLMSVGNSTITVTVYDRLENLIYTGDHPATGGGSTFFGIRTPAAIGRMVLTSIAGEGVDNLAFGDPGNVGQVQVELTVGLDSNECASDSTLTVVPGMTVYYCYRVTNNSPYTVSYHRVPDEHFGEVLDNFYYRLTPGDSVSTVDLGVSLPRVITTDTVQSGTWNAGEVSGYDAFGPPGGGTAPDISNSGTPLFLSDDGTALITLPFNYPFFDISSNQLLIGNNGLVQFNSTATSLPYINRTLPTTNLDYAIVPFWDDWDTETGNVYYDYIFTNSPYATKPGAEPSAGGNTFIVQWDDMSHVPGPNNDTVTFQLVLYPETQLMLFVYPDTVNTDIGVSYGRSATIGFNRDAEYGSLYSFNERFMGSGQGFAFGRDMGGIYFGDSATATVTVGYPEINVLPPALSQNHPNAPQTTTAVLAIENLGDGPLQWNMVATAASCLAPSPVSWLAIGQPAGVTDPNSATNVNFTFNSAGLADGIYQATLCMESNDSDEAELTIPVTLNVTNGEASVKLYLPLIGRE